MRKAAAWLVLLVVLAAHAASATDLQSPLHHVEALDHSDPLAGMLIGEEGSAGAGQNEYGVFVEVGNMMQVEKVHGYCEICIRMLQMRQHRLAHVCDGLSDTFYITCIKNLESLIKADRALVYWENIGCLHEDDGPEVVKPCPAHTVCGWVPNIFGKKGGVAGDQGLLPPLCPPDYNYQARVPKTDAPVGVPETTTPKTF